MDHTKPSTPMQDHPLNLLEIAITLFCIGSGCLLLYRFWIMMRSAQPSDIISAHHSRNLWWFFGIDILFQDMWDLRNHDASRRSFFRHQNHGQTYVTTLLGRRTVHTIDPLNIFAITTDQFDNFGKGSWTGLISRFIGDGILVNDLQDWSASRANLKPLFKRNRKQDLLMFEVHVDHLIDRLRQHGSKFVDFRKETQITVLNITIDMLWGERTSHETVLDTETLNKRMNLLKLIDDLEPYGNLAIELGPFAFPILAWRFRSILSLIRGIQEFFHEAIRNASEEMRTMHATASFHPTFVHQMLKEGMTHEKVQGELQNVFFAAFDTTAALLTNLFDCIGRDWGVQQRLKQEIVGNVGVDGRLTENSIPKLTYLRATILETLRLHTPVTSHIRKARVDTCLPRGGGESNGALFVAKNTSVVWSIFALNRQSQTYGENAMKFRPERWLDEAGGSLNTTGTTYMPFGSGPRNCLGQHFALLLVSYITARILMTVDRIELHQPHLAFEEASAVTYYNRHATKIRFETDSAIK